MTFAIHSEDGFYVWVGTVNMLETELQFFDKMLMK